MNILQKIITKLTINFNISLSYIRQMINLCDSWSDNYVTAFGSH